MGDTQFYAQEGWRGLCELSCEERMALNCQVENCRAGFSGGGTPRSRSQAWGKLLAWVLKGSMAPGNAEISGR